MELKAALRKVPRVSGQCTAWEQRAMGLDADLAQHLPPGTLDDGLVGLRDISDDDANRLLEAFFADARRKFISALGEARRVGCFQSAVEANQGPP